MTLRPAIVIVNGCTEGVIDGRQTGPSRDHRGAAGRPRPRRGRSSRVRLRTRSRLAPPGSRQHPPPALVDRSAPRWPGSPAVVVGAGALSDGCPVTGHGGRASTPSCRARRLSRRMCSRWCRRRRPATSSSVPRRRRRRPPTGHVPSASVGHQPQRLVAQLMGRDHGQPRRTGRRSGRRPARRRAERDRRARHEGQRRHPHLRAAGRRRLGDHRLVGRQPAEALVGRCSAASPSKRRLDSSSTSVGRLTPDESMIAEPPPASGPEMRMSPLPFVSSTAIPLGTATRRSPAWRHPVRCGWR